MKGPPDHIYSLVCLFIHQFSGAFINVFTTSTIYLAIYITDYSSIYHAAQLYSPVYLSTCSPISQLGSISYITNLCVCACMYMMCGREICMEAY